MNSRRYSLGDRIIIQLDRSIRAITGHSIPLTRASPAAHLPPDPLTQTERETAIRLMRVNQTGEVCAQALYQGQALTARSPYLRASLRQAADEEVDHLAWCEQRLYALNGRVSYLNPLWYLGSLSLGVLAGLAGDQWSLGFLAETEHQVEEHLRGHLLQLSKNDLSTRYILEQMSQDEAAHAIHAEDAGAHELSEVIKKAMRVMSRVMTSLAYWV